MQIKRINLEHFRNISFASVELSGSSCFFVGANGQGKTNLLEALGFISALRSFRTQDIRPLVQSGNKEAGLHYEVEQEQLGQTTVTIHLRNGQREVQQDGQRVIRFGDYLGKFPTVVFCSEDMQLLRGAPQLRRRFIDLTLSSADPAYLESLRRYHRALADRNRLLRQEVMDEESLQSFEKTLAPLALDLVTKRQEGMRLFNQVLQETYEIISGGAESSEIALEVDTEKEDVEGWLEKWRQARARDRILGSTQNGPHRDDMVFRLKGKDARDFASEGQQRGLVISLRLAQAFFYRKATGLAPVLLADDILGELDPERKARFWNAVDPTWQLVATGTVPPVGNEREWVLYQVREGSFERI